MRDITPGTVAHDFKRASRGTCLAPGDIRRLLAFCQICLTGAITVGLEYSGEL